MKTNLAVKQPVQHTAEGAVAACITPEQELRRTVAACMLWESAFYECGESIADRIKGLVPKCRPEFVAATAFEARTKMNLRHAPLLLVREMARHPEHRLLVAKLLPDVIQRADELAEFVSVYWQGGERQCSFCVGRIGRVVTTCEDCMGSGVLKGKKEPLSKQVKTGLANAFGKFNEYALAKYNRDGAVKLRDVLFLCHAKPKDDEQAALWKKLVDGKLVTPDTWEVALSGGADKRETFERLMVDGKLGALAFLRNLRNMHEAGVSKELVGGYAAALDIKRVLPFRFIAAARAVPQWEDMLEPLMLTAVAAQPKMQGRTVLAVDVSGSMNDKISAKGDMTRLDAAAALAILLREVCENFEVFAFDTTIYPVAPRRGFALRDAIGKTRGGTDISRAVTHANSLGGDRLIVLTDEQSHTRVGAPKAKHSYMVNVATNKNGVGYGNGWQHIDGWSEAVIDYLQEFENQQAQA